MRNVTVTGIFSIRRSFYGTKNCHCSRNVTITSVTVSGEACIVYASSFQISDSPFSRQWLTPSATLVLRIIARLPAITATWTVRGWMEDSLGVERQNCIVISADGKFSCSSHYPVPLLIPHHIYYALFAFQSQA